MEAAVIFTEPVTLLRPISFARRDADSLICAWHLQFIQSAECTGYLPIPSADGRISDMMIEPNCLLRLGSCAPRRSSTGKAFRYVEPRHPSVAIAGVFTVGNPFGMRSDYHRSFTVPLTLSGAPGHGHAFAYRILTPKQLDYPVECKNATGEHWVNLVQEPECPGQGWRPSQFPAAVMFHHAGSVVLNDDNLWFREGPLEYPDCLFDE